MNDCVLKKEATVQILGMRKIPESFVYFTKITAANNNNTIIPVSISLEKPT